MNNFDLFKPKKKYNISYSYEGEGLMHNLEIHAHDRDSARNLFLEDQKAKKFRKIKTFDIHQQVWGRQ